MITEHSRLSLWLVRNRVSFSIISGTLLSLGLAWVNLQYQLTNHKALFFAHIETIENEISGRMRISEGVTLGMQAFYHSSNQVSEQEFDSFVGRVTSQYPFIAAGIYSHKVTHEQRPDYEQSLRDRGIPNQSIFSKINGHLTITPQQEYYLPVTYIYPRRPNTRQWIGIDNSNQQDHLYNEVILESVTTGSTVAALPKPAITDGVHRMNIYIPIFKSKKINHTNTDAFNDLQGLVSIALRPKLMLDDKTLPDDYTITVHLGTQDKSINPYGELQWSKNTGKHRIVLDHFQKQSVSQFHSRPVYFNASRKIYLSSINLTSLITTFFTGVVISVLLSLLTRSVIAELSAKRSSRTKNEFISTVSHELRTPLTSIHGSLGLIAGGAAGEIPEQAQKLIDIASNNCGRLVRLINDILDIEKIESGAITLNKQEFDIAALAQQAVADNQSYAEKNHCHFQTLGNLTPVLVNADHDRIRQVIDNLLSNAAKFTTDGSSVDVSLATKDGHVRLNIRDHGKGVPSQFKQDIFGKFAQADSSDTKAKGGTGLGLSICKAIIRLHNGTIGFHNHKDKGASFWFELPIVSAAVSKPTDHSAKKVLICEDDKDIARLLSIYLGQVGIHCDIAFDAAQAELLLKKHHYDAMTLDLILPNKDGLQFLQELNDNEHIENLPIVVVSAVADQKKANNPQGSHNITEWVNKPIDREQLIDSVKRAIHIDPDNTPHILHIEDDQDIHLLVKKILGTEFEFDHAENIVDAKQKIQSNPYQLILLDIGLPDGSGLDLIPLINTLDEPAPIIIFSAHDVSDQWSQKVSSVMVKSKSDIHELAQQIKKAVHMDAQG